MFVPFRTIKLFPCHHSIAVLVLTGKSSLRGHFKLLCLEKIPMKGVWYRREGDEGRLGTEILLGFEFRFASLKDLLPIHLCLVNQMIPIEINVSPHIYGWFAFTNGSQLYIITQGHSLHSQRRGYDQTTTFPDTHTFHSLHQSRLWRGGYDQWVGREGDEGRWWGGTIRGREGDERIC